MSQISVLTNAQIMTLRRMKNGTKYQMTSNGKHGRQVRLAAGSKFIRDDVECKSLSPLMRKGFIKFRAASVCDNGSYYEVELTTAGRTKVDASYGDEEKPHGQTPLPPPARNQGHNQSAKWPVPQSG